MRLTKIKKGKPYLFTDVKSWGGKGDNLLKLSEVFDVPQGFVISSDTYTEWIRSTQLDVILRRILNEQEPEQAYENIRKIFLSTNLQTDLASKLETEFSKVKKPLVARSSSVNEDGNKNSYAGQHESILGITEFPEFLESIKEVYASLHTPRAIEYRRNQSLPNDDAIAVVVQAMVNPVASGVAYSPSPKNIKEILIESSWGLCTSVVDGKTCDIYNVLDAITENMVQDISPKKREMEIFDLKTKKIIAMPVPKDKIAKPSLTNIQVLEVAQVVKMIERSYGMPMDMEFAYEKETGQLYVLQARPLTGIVATEEDIPLPDIPLEKIIVRSKNIRKPGNFEGPVIVVRRVDHINKVFDVDGDLIELNKEFNNGYILLAPEIPPQLEQYVTNARAMFATECGTTGHAAAIACEKGIIYLGRGVTNIPDILHTVRSGMNLGIAVSKKEGEGILYVL